MYKGVLTIFRVNLKLLKLGISLNGHGLTKRHLKST